MNSEIRRRGVALFAAALLVFPAAVLAQGMSGHHQGPASGAPGGMVQGQGMMGGGMMGGGMMTGRMPGTILAQKDALGLTAEQTARLDSLQTQVEQTRKAHWTLMQGIHRQMGELSNSEKPDLDRYQTLMQEMATSGIAMHVQVAKLSRAAEQVLTADQRSKLDSGRRSTNPYGMGHRGMMGSGAMGGAYGPGMMGPSTMGGTGRTSGCGNASGSGSSGR